MCEWIYGTGMPKSLNIGKVVDKKQGNEREVIGIGVSGKEETHQTYNMANGGGSAMGGEYEITKGTSEWEGWGTSLKPAHEPICVARKPFQGSVTENVLKWGNGGLNIDACRVGCEPVQEQKGTHQGRFPANLFLSHHPDCVLDGTKEVVSNSHFPDVVVTGYGKNYGGKTEYIAEGERIKKELVESWTCHPDCPIRMLDEQSGITESIPGVRRNKNTPTVFEKGFEGKPKDIFVGHQDTGGASRFFYCPKSSKSERNDGCDRIKAEAVKHYVHNRRCKICGHQEVSGSPCVCPNPDWEIIERETIRGKNYHPTVKPISLMEYLVELVTKPNYIVLDPFLGSGTTAVACKKLGRVCLGFEQNEDYASIIDARTGPRGLFLFMEDE
jgi:site-specific DNA-methyltransferase (adenine-specific)